MEKGAGLTNVSRKNWSISIREQGTGLYALALIDVTNAATAVGYLNAPVTNSSSLGTTDSIEFVFNIAPKDMEMDEPAAVTIVPTQDGGQFVEHQGSIYKNISISGTTGMRPNRKGPGIIPILNLPNPLASFLTDIDSDTNLPKGERTGFDDFIKLRNLFRQYFDFKKDAAQAYKWQMVWQNGKEGEFYIVEPISFRTKRSSSSPVTFEYDIQLRTIKKLELTFLANVDAQRNINSVEALAQKYTKIIRGLANALGTAQAFIDRSVMVGQSVVTLALAPGRAILEGLAGVINSSTGAFSIPRNGVALFAQSSNDLFKAMADFDRASDSYTTTGTMSQLARSRQAYKSMMRIGAKLHATDTLYSQSIGGVFNRRAKAYINPVTGKPFTGGSASDPANSSPPSATSISTVFTNDTIYTLAQRLLGDAAKWKDLVILNGLISPYISINGNGTSVLRPNDQILFPAIVTTQKSNVAQDLNQDSNALTQRLGRDIRLLTEGSSTGFDFAINSNGDLSTIVGVENMKQAVVIKFSTEQGSLPTHSFFGIAAPIGRKVSIRSLIGFQINARASLLSDSRITGINSLQFFVDGNVLTISSNLQIANSDQSVAISFDAKR